MDKVIAALGIVGVLLPIVAPVAETVGPTASAGVQIGGVAVVGLSKALVDVQGILAKLKEKRARRAAARR